MVRIFIIKQCCDKENIILLGHMMLTDIL